jgi:predicted RNA-binding Zn ribbon-like protein
MEGMSVTTIFASERYNTSIAPDGLRLTQELINSIGHPRPPLGADLLGDLGDAQPWLDDIVRAWSDLHHQLVPQITLTEDDLRDLRELRASLRQILGAPGNTVEIDASPAITADVRVILSPQGATLMPSGAGVTWLKAAIALEWVLADQHDELRRLKLCRNLRCGVAFYDRSKNNSRAWHDVMKCGNLANVRAYRSRQQGDRNE